MREFNSAEHLHTLANLQQRLIRFSREFVFVVNSLRLRNNNQFKVDFSRKDTPRLRGMSITDLLYSSLKKVSVNDSFRLSFPPYRLSVENRSTIKKRSMYMNQQDKQEPTNQQSVIEDLALNQDRAEDVKGGTSNPPSWGLDRIDQR